MSSFLTVFDVQHFCFQDGPGIRTTIFTKGCSLRCAWCHNPESLRSGPEILYYREKCCGCGLCVSVCPNGAHHAEADGHVLNYATCDACGKCAEVCPARALELAGRFRSTDSLLEEILRDDAVYKQTGGGVTVSGGEPLLQSAAVADLLAACQVKGIHTAIETAGNIPRDNLHAVMPYTDLMLWDVKTATPSLHKSGTGSDNQVILTNLDYLLSRYGGEVWIRIPVIPGINATVEEMANIRRLLRGMQIKRVELLPYHEIASSKYQALGLNYGLADTPIPDSDLMDRLRDELSGNWTTV